MYTGSFLVVKQRMHGINHQTLSDIKAKERVELQNYTFTLTLYIHGVLTVLLYNDT